MRRFVDTNDDNVVDQWSYYKDGLEVYRDIDSNFNGKADQHRWFHTGGSRWGLDSSEDGVIDSWKAISAEEVSAEVVAAIAAHDAAAVHAAVAFARRIALAGPGQVARPRPSPKRLDKAAEGFKTMAARQKAIGPDAVWVQFSANRPGVIPAGTDQSTKDLRVYENAMAIVESGGKHGQVQIGTLIQVGDAWRLIDLPQPVGEGQAEASPGGFFFQASLPRRSEPAAGAPSETTAEVAGRPGEPRPPGGRGRRRPRSKPQYTARRADLLMEIAAAARTGDERGMWLRQLADMISAAVQSGTCPDGAQRLKSLFEKLQQNEADKNLAAYVKFRQLNAAYVLSMQAPKADFAKIQAQWLKTLEQYVADYPDRARRRRSHAAVGHQPGVRRRRKTTRRSGTPASSGEFPDSPAAKKAAGAQTRLDSVGKVIALSGQSPLGSPVDLADYRGKVVLIHYWATWSRPAKADLATLKELWNKYGSSFTIVGVSLDNNAKELDAYLADNPLPWPQIFETGGLDSRPANALGILTVPTMILVDQQGKVVNRNIAAADLEAELKRLIR